LRVRELVREIAALDEETVLAAVKDVVALTESCVRLGGKRDQQIVFGTATEMLSCSIEQTGAE
jgi:hypothetical protein